VRLGTVPPLVAEITAASAHALGLVPGARVFAAIKATEIDVYER
jgi:molybdopterin-binding protein